MTQPLGLYVSVPFCRAKCTFCNFASAAFPPERMEAYVDRLIADFAAAPAWAEQHDLDLPRHANTVFLGGGTPSLLSAAQMQRLLTALRSTFTIAPTAEITVEAAPGQLADDLLDTMQAGGVNRISLGVQSFVDAESRAVGRLHTAVQCLAEIDRLRAAGIPRLSLDLIVGLPLQTEESWLTSLQAAIDSGVEHVSVYMLEIDEDSRLGSAVLDATRALSQLAVLGQQARYRADAVPDADRTAALYDHACTTLADAGLAQYEISNFGNASRHNLKYWHRAPYLGFGLDAHSMLLSSTGQPIRFAQTDALKPYLATTDPVALEPVTPLEAFEEAVFLGLRLNTGISLNAIAREHGTSLADGLQQRAQELAGAGVLQRRGDRLSLTQRGRSISSAVFGELLAVPA